MGRHCGHLANRYEPLRNALDFVRVLRSKIIEMLELEPGDILVDFGYGADPDEIEVLMRELGYAVERDAVGYAHTILGDSHSAMVENRYMSALSSLSDVELMAGLAEIQDSCAEWAALEFSDHLDFILGIQGKTCFLPRNEIQRGGGFACRDATREPPPRA